MRKSREVLEYRWQEMSVIASDTYEDGMDVDANSADADQVSAELPAANTAAPARSRRSAAARMSA